VACAQSCISDLGATSTRFRDVLDFGFSQLVNNAIRLRIRPLVDSFSSTNHNISEVSERSFTVLTMTVYYNYNRFMALWILSGTTQVRRYKKGKTKTSLDFLEQETVSGSGISWAICRFAPHHSVFYRPVVPDIGPLNGCVCMYTMSGKKWNQ